MTDVHVKIPHPDINEGNSFTATAYFRNASTGAAEAPTTNVKYRLDNVSTGQQILDWTSATPASEVSISITSAHNKILSRQAHKQEIVQLVVAADRGETSANYSTIQWKINNVFGYYDNV